MSANLSAEQVREKHVKALPGDTGPLYHALYNSLVTANLSWIVFKELFAKSKERVDLLNRTAGTFFLVTQETLRRDVMLAIARMTDSSRGQENATVGALVNELTPHVDDATGRELAQQGAELLVICKPIQMHRHKTLAHSDKMVAVGSANAPVLPGVTMETVDAALDGIAGILNRVSAAFGIGTTFYEDVIHSGGVDSLVVHLRAAELFHEAQRRSTRD